MSYAPFCDIPSRARAKPIEIQAGDGSESHALGKAVLAPLVYAGLNVTLANGGSSVKLQDSTGLANVLVEAFKTKNPKLADELLGAEADQAKIAEWLGKAEATGASLGTNSKITDAVTDLDAFLANGGLCGGAQVNVADLALYGAVHDLVSALSTEEQLTISNVTRHFVQTQHLFALKVNPLPSALSRVDVNLDPAPQPLKSLIAAAEDGASREDKKKEKKKEKEDKKKFKAERQAARTGGAATAADDDDDAEPSAAIVPTQEPSSVTAPPAKAALAATVPKAVLTPEQAKVASQIVMRVGLIKKAWAHKDAEKLYVEEIDVGEKEVRTICSGLREFVAEKDMQNRRVIVLCNLKPRNLVGVASNGMVLAASNKEHTAVELLDPPAGAAVGERITLEGVTDLKDEVLNPKKKIWETFAEGLEVNSQGEATYQGVVFQTSAGPVTAPKLRNCHIG